ncbi:hypothetical protein CSA37_07195 [Candidatus Fermentibacteria bacterium]|nr:MAG: hypothetical protein CSA37_10090 [Candidatus Fermentibacteria bacterium]PIE52343.1 MAG: hypothetical protein CSA37_07195 [Candidatus Fermentibacteria bacterium]
MTAVLLAVIIISSPAREECIDFLLSNSPSSDRSGESLTALQENVDLALLAVETMPWGESIPDSVFLRYVLPARVSQEPLVAWRPVFREALLPLLEGVNTIEEATVVIGGWCDSITEYQPTQVRDQSPFVTWSSGTGRCEELTVFYMDALRSVSIPCRQVFTPYWITCDSNHAWPEVWTESGWVYADISTEDLNKLPEWFDDRVSKAAIVVAITTGNAEGALRQLGSVSLVPVTETYAQTGLLTIADDSAEVVVSVANYGALREIVTMTPELRQVELGEGRFVATWGWPVRGTVFEIIPGEETVIVPDDSQMLEELHINLREEQI